VLNFRRETRHAGRRGGCSSIRDRDGITLASAAPAGHATAAAQRRRRRRRRRRRFSMDGSLPTALLLFAESEKRNSCGCWRAMAWLGTTQWQQQSFVLHCTLKKGS
jgi:hypothetical protein